VLESDIEHWPERESPLWQRRSYLDFSPQERPAGNMITNPPFSLLNEFIEHSIAMEFDKCALLVPLTALGGIERFNKFFFRPQTQPSRVWIMSRRLRFKRQGYSGRIAPMGSHAWMVWDRTNLIKGHPILGWICANGEPQ
jgi:hypothetical protein